MYLSRRARLEPERETANGPAHGALTALFAGAAVLANNLIIIGELLTKRSRRRRKTKRQFLS